MGVLLDKQHRFYVQNEEQLIEDYEGQYIVIHDEKVVDRIAEVMLLW